MGPQEEAGREQIGINRDGPALSKTSSGNNRIARLWVRRREIRDSHRFLKVKADGGPGAGGRWKRIRPIGTLAAGAHPGIIQSDPGAGGMGEWKKALRNGAEHLSGVALCGDG